METDPYAKSINALMGLMELQQKQIVGLIGICENLQKQMDQHRSNCQARHNPPYA